MHEETVWPKFRYSQLLRRHRVGELLTGIGYRYHHFGNLHDGLRSSEFAAENYRFSAMESELGENLLRLTPLGPLTAPHSLREQELKKFAGVAAAAQNGRPEPKFVYAHFMLPHEPWKFDEQGHEPSELDIAQRGETNCYVRQLRFTNARILELIDSIRAGSARPPIIVLQADEGPELRYEHDAALSAEQKIRKRCGILSAFLLPERDGAKLVSPGITPVNTFRLIFREYFAADLPPLADRSYYFEPANPWGKPDLTQPCRFVDVTEIVRSP